MSEPIEKKNASNHMTNEEIIVRYRQAKDKTEQVKILADLNACTTDKIINILVNEGGYKIQHFNKLIRKLNNGGKTVPNKKEYKKPEIITEEKAINLEKSAAEFVAEKTEDELADLKKREEMYKLEINKIKTIKPDDVLGTTKAITEDENGVTFDIELTDKGKTAINEIINHNEDEDKNSELESAIAYVRQAIELIDMEIAELKAERERILAACQGGVPF